MQKRGSRLTLGQRALLEGLTNLAMENGLEIKTTEVPSEIPSTNLSEQLTRLNEWETIGRQTRIIVGGKTDYGAFLKYLNETVGKFIKKIEQAHIDAKDSTLCFKQGVYLT